MHRIVWSVLLLIGLTSTTIIAQGVISGTVFDESTGETVIGASVVEPTTGKITITDFDGKYRVELEPGIYSLQFTYIGFPDLTIEGIEVKDGEITYQDITMDDSEGVSLEELGVTVSATRITNSEVATLIQRREAAVVSDNISAQEMARYGASDAGGALKKVTGTSVEGGRYIYVRGLGDRYSLVQLNGLTLPSTDPYRNSAQLDLIPTNLIDNISTAKTSSPDQPGNFTGGNVNIVTKKFPELETFTISLSGGFNNQSNLIDNFLTQGDIGSDYFGFDNRRAIPSVLTDPEIRPLINEQSERLARRFGNEEAANALDLATRSVIAQVAPNETRSSLDHGISLSYGNRIDFGENKLGIIATASFKQDYQNVNDVQVGRWQVDRADPDSLDNFGDFIVNRSVLNPTLSGLVGLTYRIGPNSEIGLLGMYNHTATTTSLTSLGERPDNAFFPRLLEGFQQSHVEQELINYQLNGEHIFPNLNNLKIEWRGSIVNSSQYEPQTRFFENLWNVETDQYLFDGSDINAPFYFWRDLDDEQLTGKVDITIPFGARANSFKIGGLYSNKDRFSSQEVFRMASGAAAARLDEFGGDQNSFVQSENIGVIGRDEDGDFQIGNFLFDDTELADTYNGSELITAVYGMLTYELTDKLKFVGGARLESTDFEAVSLDTTESVGRINETDLLPSVNLIYEFVEDFNIRASYSRTIARPTLREISSFTILEPLTNTFERGNPDSLGRSLIDNFDLRLEYFLGGNEVIAISGYYKDFTDPIARVQLPISPNNEFQFQNVGTGYLLGLEFELRKRLNFISEKLQNFSFVTNLSYIDSDILTNTQTNTDLAIRSRNFVGQPDYIVNAALNFVQPDQGWDIALALNRTGDRVTIIGSPSGSRRDLLTRARSQLDLVASKRFGNMKIRLGVLNILDDPYTISTEYVGEEYIFEDFRQGLDFRFNIGYTF